MHNLENEYREARLRILTEGLRDESDWPLAVSLIRSGHATGSYRCNNLGASKPFAEVTLGGLSDKGRALVETLVRQRKRVARRRAVMCSTLLIVTLFVGFSLGIGLSRADADFDRHETLTVLNTPGNSNIPLSSEGPRSRP
jgi:hypothetical protein